MKLVFAAAFLLLVAIAIVGACGCGGGLAAEDGRDLENAARLTGASYAHQDASTAGATLIREAHCAIQKVITDEKLPPVDGGIACN